MNTIEDARKICDTMFTKQNMIPPTWLLCIAYPSKETHEWTEEDDF